MAKHPNINFLKKVKTVSGMLSPLPILLPSLPIFTIPYAILSLGCILPLGRNISISIVQETTPVSGMLSPLPVLLSFIPIFPCPTHKYKLRTLLPSNLRQSLVGQNVGTGKQLFIKINNIWKADVRKHPNRKNFLHRVLKF